MTASSICGVYTILVPSLTTMTTFSYGATSSDSASFGYTLRSAFCTAFVTSATGAAPVPFSSYATWSSGNTTV